MWRETNSLPHSQQHCKVALNLHRYKNQHDEILRIISDFIKQQVPDDMTVLTDLSDQYQFLPSLALTDLRPDLVAYSDLTKSVIIVELTVCYETNYKEAQARKETELVGKMICGGLGSQWK